MEATKHLLIFKFSEMFMSVTWEWLVEASILSLLLIKIKQKLWHKAVYSAIFNMLSIHLLN